MLKLDPTTTGLVLVDLQEGVLPMGQAPRSARDVVEAAKALADKFRDVGAAVFLIHVDFPSAVQPSRNVDEPGIPPEGTPSDYATLVEGLAKDGDVVILKHHWGAFTGTDLDLQLRRRGVRTIVIGGIATNFGVESTVRSAWELSYDVVVAEDLTASVSQDYHDFSVSRIFPKIARVASSDEIRLASD